MRRRKQVCTLAMMLGVALAMGLPGLAWSWSWSAETADNASAGLGVGQYTSLKLDTSGRPRISYYDAANKNLKYAVKLSTGGWSIGVVDSVGDVEKWTSLALGPDNLAHISYYDATNGKIKYARRTLIGPVGGSPWVIETVATTPFGGSWTSIAYIDGYPHISYYAAGEGLKYIHKTSAGWSTPETVDSAGFGISNSLQFDTSGNPHIAYADDAISPAGTLKYATKSRGVWNPPHIVETSDSPIPYVSLALDSHGRPHIAFYDTNTSTAQYIFIRYMYWDGASWKDASFFVDQDPEVQGIALALDSSDQAHISYYAQPPSICSNYCLQYARRSGTTWVKETPDLLAALLGINHGKHPSIAIDTSNKPHISYHVIGETLRYTRGQ